MRAPLSVSLTVWATGSDGASLGLRTGGASDTHLVHPLQFASTRCSLGHAGLFIILCVIYAIADIGVSVRVVFSTPEGTAHRRCRGAGAHLCSHSFTLDVWNSHDLWSCVLLMDESDDSASGALLPLSPRAANMLTDGARRFLHLGV